MKNRIIMIGDMHESSAAVELLNAALPELFKLGYQTLYIEITDDGGSGDNAPEELIKEFKIILNLQERFPGGRIPENLNDSQRAYLQNKSSKQIMDINHNLETFVNRIEWVKTCIRLFENIIALKMRLIAIDVDDPSKYEKTYGIQERNDYMLGKIALSNLQGGAIIFVGITHIINVWEGGCYNRGLLHYLSRDKRYEIKRAYFPFYSNTIVKEALNYLASGDEFTIACVQKTQYEHTVLGLETAKNVLVQNNKPAEAPRESTIKTYTILNINRESTLRYLCDLGAEIVDQDNNHIVFKISNHLLIKQRRELLGLYRGRIPLLTETGRQRLVTEIPTITIEEDPGTPGTHLLLTFPLALLAIKKRIIDQILTENSCVAPSTYQEIPVSPAVSAAAAAIPVYLSASLSPGLFKPAAEPVVKESTVGRNNLGR